MDLHSLFAQDEPCNNVNGSPLKDSTVEALREPDADRARQIDRSFVDRQDTTHISCGYLYSRILLELAEIWIALSQRWGWFASQAQ